MPFAWDSVIGKITLSLMSSSYLKWTSTMSPTGPATRFTTCGKDARRVVGSMVTLPSECNRARPECKRADMPLSDGADAQDEPTSSGRRCGLVGMQHNARIEEG